jgi:hypothetical protein
MTSQVLTEFEVESVDDARLREAYAGPAAAYFGDETSAFEEQGDGLHVFPAEGRKCAKGLLVALGMEAGAALCIVGLWQVWHLLR